MITVIEGEKRGTSKKRDGIQKLIHRQVIVFSVSCLL